MVHGRFNRLVTVPRLAAGAAFLLIASVVFLLSGGHGSSFQDQLRAGKHPQSPAFMLRIAWPRINTWPTGAEAADHHGQISIDDLRGYPVVLVFWNTSCVRCAQEARVYAVESRRYSGKAVFLGVSVLDLTPARLLAPANVPFPSLDDVDGRVAKLYGVTRLPATLWLDRAGHVDAYKSGLVSPAVFRQNLARALE